ncbi:MAG: PQQ-binding-like beta-propeller repeat protein [Gammaproteobacteria bacterium]|nr:PQQ-binding-like beta-propeller repeat protein [Gammaproteobacteria bacterium]
MGDRRRSARTRAAIARAVIGLAGSAAAGLAAAQDIPLSYTDAQADDGARIYAQTCAQCHGANLDDGPLGAPLKGVAFMDKYGGGSVFDLFDVTRRTMPTSSPGSLDVSAYASLVAYLLRANDIVAGDTALPTDPRALAAMRIPEGGFSFMAYSPYTERVTVELPTPLEDFEPVDDAALADPPAADWLGWRRSYDAHGFSPLASVDTRNAGDLRLAWSWTLPAGSNEGVPLVRDGTMFVVSYGDVVQALDAATGDLLWQYSHTLEEGASPFHKRGLALYGDRLYLGTSDVHVVALDVHTGEPVWDTRVGDFRVREGINGGPLAARGRVMIGTTGTGVGAKPGGPQIVGLDAETGEIAWRLGTIPRPGEPGGDSWNGMPYEERSGASVWTPGSYDPETGLAYFGTGNTYDTGPLLEPSDAPGVTNDALYTNSTLAVDPDTGELVWHFQHFPNDQWDLDWAFERQLLDLNLAGRERQVALTAGKLGIYEALDAETGEFLFAIDLGLQNIVTEIDQRSGAKTVNRDLYPGDGEIKLVCPHGAGAKNYLPASYDASRGRLFVPLNEACMDLYPVPGGGRGGLSSGVNWGIRPRPDSDGNYGRLQAIDVATGETVWTARQRAPQTSGVLATAGGVVFAASFDRNFRAYDQRDGDVLWEARLNDVSSSSPITYAVDGRQYVALVVGEGGFHARSFAPLVPELRSPPNRGATVWVFALPE